MPESVTATKLRAGEGVELFAYLKITGLPYYFFCAIDPTDTKHGAAAWTLPTGYTAVRGMMAPSDHFEQSVKDIIGGIASAERITLTLLDAEASDANGTYEYLSRIFASGRVFASGPQAELETVIGSAATTGGTFQVRQASSAFVADSYIHIGGECLQVQSATAPAGTGNRSTVTIKARNVFPCSSVYPPTPVHTVDIADFGGAVIGRNPPVTREPVTMIGRSAAYYIGYMRADGTPCPESECMLRLVGHIADISYNDTGAAYEVSIAGVLDQMDEAFIAPGLAKASLPDQIVLTDPEWRSFFIELQTTDKDQVTAWQSLGRTIVTVDNGGDNVYKDAHELCAAINAALHARLLAYVDGLGRRYLTHEIQAYVTRKDGARYFGFMMSKAYPGNSPATRGANGGFASRWRIFNGGGSHSTQSLDVPLGAPVGLLSAMGFAQPVLDPDALSADEAGRPAVSVIEADRPAPSVFVPFSGRWFSATTVKIQGADALPVNRFFTDQLDGSGAAWVRFGDKQIARCVSTAITGASGFEVSTISVREKPPAALVGAGVDDVVAFGGDLFRWLGDYFYYCPAGQPAIVEQVLLQPGSAADADLGTGRLIGRLISGRAKFGAEDPPATKFPDGVGMNWYDVLDAASFRRSDPADLRRFVVVDRETKFSDIFEPIARYYGWLLAWDPSAARVSLKRVRLPSAAVSAQPILSESNRASITDRTRQNTDRANVRTGWTLKHGWDPVKEKFASEFTMHDEWARTAYGASIKPEKIEDKTIAATNLGSPTETFAGLIWARNYFYRYPWDKARRSINRVGLVMCPGSVHQIVDNTLINPFTGRRGIAEADRVYGIVTGVSAGALGGEGEVTFLISRQDPGALLRPWSPCALVDFDAANHGYNSGTGVLTLKSHYASDGVSYDGIDFRVGDLVTLVARDSVEATPTYSQNTTVSAVATNGLTITVAAGLPALPADTDVIVILRRWETQTAARKTGADATAFQCGQGGTFIVGGETGHKWL